MNNTPAISVVIPAYNAARWIGETIQSVLAQDFTDFEVIVVDDGSTDDTVAVIKPFGERLHCICKPNGGTASARNTGIATARGEYIAFVDADDLWVKDKLRLQWNLLKRTGLAWVYSDAFAFDGETGNILMRFGKLYRQYKGDILRQIFLTDFIPSPTPVITRHVFDQVGYFCEDRTMQNREDWNMWIKIAGCYPIGLIPEALAYYRVYNMSKTGSLDPEVSLKETLGIIEEAVAHEPLRLSPLRNHALANCYVGAGRDLARTGDLKKAKQMFHRALRLTPMNMEAYLYLLGCLSGKRALHFAIQLRRWFRYSRSLVKADPENILQ